MTRVARRWGLAVSAGLVTSLMTVPAHASEAPEPDQAAPAEAAGATAARTTAAKPAAKEAAAAPARKYWVSLRVNSGETQVYTRENFWLRGRVFTTQGKPQANVAVKIYRDTKKGRTKVATVRTQQDGSYIWTPKNRQVGKYRAVATSVRYSPKVALKVRTGKRELAARKKSLSFLLGSARTGVRRTGGYQWQEFSKAVLIQRGTRTWVVRGSAIGELKRNGGPGAKLGAPTGDTRCGLPEGGCLQQFTKGAIYTNPKAKDKLTSAVAGKLGAADLIAVARSQVGYREPSPRKSKYNKWIGRTGPSDPWCGYFMSWLAHAAGKPGAVIKSKSFSALLKAEKKRGRTSKTPRVGRLAYIDYFVKATPSHVGIVTKVDGKHIWLVEGNVSAGGGSKHPRGVHVVKRDRSQVSFYADPKY